MTWVYLVVGLLIAGLVAMAVIGARLPREHVASRTVTLQRSPDAVWPVLMGALNASPVPVDILETDPPRRLVSRVKASEKQFGGTWTITIAPASSGSLVTVTEEGWVANPLFRFVSRFLIGHHATIDRMLKALPLSPES